MGVYQQGTTPPAPPKLSIFQNEDGSFEVYFHGNLVEPSEDGLVHINDDGEDCVIITAPMDFLSVKEKSIILKTDKEDNTFYFEDSETGTILHVEPLKVGGLLHVLPDARIM